MKIKILDIHVQIDEYLEVTGHTASAGMLPFHGHATSPYFNGIICSGAVDTQIKKNGQEKHLSARYMLKGTDLTGTECHIFIENEGTLTEGEIITTPKIITDSKNLSFLETASLQGRVISKDNGVLIEIYETLFEHTRIEHSFSCDDKQVYGEFYLPADGKETHPLLIASHGYNSCCMHLRDILGLIAGCGIAVYAYDFCGGGNTTKSSGTPTEMSIITEQTDLQNVLSHVKTLKGIDANRIFLYGESQGGFVTALTAPKFSHQIKGLFLVYPAFCIPDDWADTKKNYPPFIYFNGMTIGKRYIEDIPDYDVFMHAAQYPGNVTIFHGTDDALVPIRYSKKLEQSYQNAVLLTYPGQDHGFDKYHQHLTAEYVAASILSQ